MNTNAIRSSASSLPISVSILQAIMQGQEWPGNRATALLISALKWLTYSSFIGKCIPLFCGEVWIFTRL